MIRYIFCEEVESTSTSLLQELKTESNILKPIVVAADRQNKGRGTHQRSWVSNSSKNIYMSIGWNFEKFPASIPLLTLCIGIQLAQKLSERFGIDIQIKWPNDLYCDNRKIAGILTESFIKKGELNHLIVGIGLNLNSQLNDFPKELNDRAGSIAASIFEKNKTTIIFEKKEVILFIAEIINNTLSEIIKSDDAGVRFLQKNIFAKKDYLFGKKIQINSENQIFKGVAYGISSSGALQIQTENQIIRSFQLGDIELL